jgi:tetrahydromethanopterin S-methyltransferase subunit G
MKQFVKSALRRVCAIEEDHEELKERLDKAMTRIEFCQTTR